MMGHDFAEEKEKAVEKLMIRLLTEYFIGFLSVIEAGNGIDKEIPRIADGMAHDIYEIVKKVRDRNTWVY